MQVASRIKELREISGYSRHAVAKLVGVDYETYKGYEENGTDIPISVLYKLANEFGVRLYRDSDRQISEARHLLCREKG